MAAFLSASSATASGMQQRFDGDRHGWGGGKSALVECGLADETENGLSPEDEAGALKVAAFLMEYYSEGGQWSALDKPLNTITAEPVSGHRVHQGRPVCGSSDIRLRMLTPANWRAARTSRRTTSSTVVTAAGSSPWQPAGPHDETASIR